MTTTMTPPPPAAPPPGADHLPPVVPGPRAARRWLALGSALAALSLAFGSISVVGLLAHEERTEVIVVDDAGVRSLDIASDAGRIEVVGADVEEITITARVSDGLRATELTQAVVADQLQVRVRCRGHIANQWCRADLVIEVPRSLDLTVRAADSSVTVDELAGRIDLESENGSLTVTALDGPARLRTENGSIRAQQLRSLEVDVSTENGSLSLEFADAPQVVVAATENGSVDVALPRTEASYAVIIDTGNGSVDNQIRTDPEGSRRMEATSENGDVTLRYLS